MNSNHTITKEKPFKICFVCLGNICRSPTAEGIFQHLVNEKKLQSYFFVDSAGTSAFHIGEKANSKSRQIAEKNGVELKSRARRLEEEDLEVFDLVVAMDSENHQNILSLDKNGSYVEKIIKMREYDSQPDNGDVPDPYYGGIDGFKNVFDIIYRSCEALLDELENQVHS